MTHFLVNQTRPLVQESSPPREGGPTPAQKEGLIFIGCGAPWGFPGGAEVKNSPASARATGDVGSVPGGEDSLEEEMATHSSIFAWTESLVGYSPRGHKASDITEQLNTWARGVPRLLQSAPLGVSRSPTDLVVETLRPEGMFAGGFGGKFPHLEKRLPKRRLSSSPGSCHAWMGYLGIL